MENVLQFLLENLPIVICLLVGVALLVIEIFMPGFGVAGISGILLMVASIVLVWMNHGTLAGLAMTVVALAMVGISISISLKSVSSGKLSKSDLILKNNEQAEEVAAAGRDMESLLGKKGVTATVLRPAGLADFDGVRLNVVSGGEFIQKGESVVICHVEGTRIVVKQAA